MACNCNKNKTSSSRGPAIRPGVYNRASVGALTAPARVRSQSQAEIHNGVEAQSLPSAKKEDKKQEIKGTNAARRKIQALRREAIFKALGK